MTVNTTHTNEQIAGLYETIEKAAELIIDMMPDYLGDEDKITTDLMINMYEGMRKASQQRAAELRA